MRAVRLPSGDVAFPPDVLAGLAPGMVRQLEEARRLRISVPDDVVASIELADLVGAAWRNRTTSVPQSSAAVPNVDTSSSDPSRWLTVEQVASQLGIGERAVRKRCLTGTLRARKLLGEWRIDPAAIKESA